MLVSVRCGETTSWGKVQAVPWKKPVRVSDLFCHFRCRHRDGANPSVPTARLKLLFIMWPNHSLSHRIWSRFQLVSEEIMYIARALSFFSRLLAGSCNSSMARIRWALTAICGALAFFKSVRMTLPCVDLLSLLGLVMCMLFHWQMRWTNAKPKQEHSKECMCYMLGQAEKKWDGQADRWQRSGH